MNQDSVTREPQSAKVTHAEDAEVCNCDSIQHHEYIRNGSKVPMYEELIHHVKSKN